MKEIIGFILFVLIIGFIIWRVAVICVTYSNCVDACNPDKVDSHTCFDDRVICIAKDKTYIKEIK